MTWLVDHVEWGLNQLGLDGWDIQLAGDGVKVCWPHGSFVVRAEDVPLGQVGERWLAQLRRLHEGIGRVG